LTVPTVADLPTQGVVEGSLLYVSDNETLYTFNGSTWSAVAGGGSGAVDSINGLTGVVELTGADIDLTDSGPIQTQSLRLYESTDFSDGGLTFGETGNDTGFTSPSDGVISVYANAVLTAQFTPNGLSQVRGVDYTWPNGQGAAATALVNDGNGQLSWSPVAADITGNVRSFAGFDDDGELYSVPGYTFGEVTHGQIFNHTIVPSDQNTFNALHTHYSAINAADVGAIESWNLHFYEGSIGDDMSALPSEGSLFGVGVSLRSIQASNTGNMTPFAAYMTVGNGTDPLTSGELKSYDSTIHVAAGCEASKIIGQNINIGVDATALVAGQTLGSTVNGAIAETDQFFGYVQGLNISSAGDVACFQTAHGLTDVSNTVNAFTDFNQQSGGTIGSNYFSAALQPNLETLGGSFFGVNIAPNVGACQSAEGIVVDMQNVTSSGTVRAARFMGDVEIQGSLQFSGGLTIGKLTSTSGYTVADGGGNPASNNLLVTMLTATGTVANCDTIAFNTSCLVNMDATFVGTSGPFGLGLASLALPNVISMQAGATLDNLTACVYANVFDAGNTGGTIGRLIGARSFNVSTGGTQTITQSINFFADYGAGDVAVNSWGFYDSGAKYNYLANALKIGGSDTTAHAFEVDGAAAFTGNLGFFGTSPVSQPASSGAATAGVLYTSVEQTMLQEVYNAVRALGLMS
jgi:hypothetical protein